MQTAKRKQLSDLEVLEQAFGALSVEKRVGLRDRFLLIGFNVGKDTAQKLKPHIKKIWRKVKPFFVGDDIKNAEIYVKDSYIVLVYEYKTVKAAKEAYNLFKKALNHASHNNSSKNG